MKISIEWISDYVKVPDVERLSKDLTMAGLNVDEVIRPHVEGKVVAGRIVKVEKHPRSDKLLVCDVDVGDRVLKIVTGDLKVEEGYIVPVALPGTRTADGKLIEVSQIKGVKSEGMMCSLMELGISEQSDRIHVFEKDIKPGTDLVKLLHLNDTVLDIEITPNRGDLLSYIGVAREISAIYDVDLEIPDPIVRSDTRRTEEFVEIVIEDVEGCPRYAGMVIRGVEVKESPIWLKRRLMASGIRPINNVVDATNYVMLETGHPIHAFDYDLIKTKKVVVRKGKEGEKVLLLDEKEYTLKGGETLITDGGKEIIAVGGVMGAMNSGINEKTKDVFVEVAYFDPVRIRKTKKGLGIDSDASYRFERGVDPNDVEYVMKRVVSLIQEIAGGVATSNILDVYPKKIEPITIHLRREKLNSTLDLEIPDSEVERIMRRLGFEMERSSDGWNVTVPTFRIHDVQREIDLVEEIGRIHGYDKVPSVPPVIEGGSSGLSDYQKFRRKIVDLMKSFGFDEVETFSFTSSKRVEGWKFTNLKTLELLNPITDDLDVMRESLVYTLIDVASYNYTHQRRNVKIFEIGKIYWEDETFKEAERLGAIAIGLENERDYTDRRKVDFLTFKGVLDGIFSSLGLEVEYKPADLNGFVPTRCAEIFVDGVKVGFIGMVDPDVSRSFDLKDDLYYFEIDLEEVFKHRLKIPRYRPSPSFPSIRRDVSLLIDRNGISRKVIDIFKEVGKDLVEEVGVSDVYRGEGIPEGTMSVTFYVIFRSKERTLKDDEVNDLFERMIEQVERRLGIRRRY